MQQMTEEQKEEEHQEVMQWATKRRWVMTGIYSLFLSFGIEQVYSKRAQLPFLFAWPPATHLPILGDIFTCVGFSVSLVELWSRIHAYRREQLIAEQKDFQKATVPSEGV